MRCRRALASERVLDGRWPSMLMQAGQNPNAIGKHNVEQRVRKARDERAPSLTVSQGTGERVLGDEMHDEAE